MNRHVVIVILSVIIPLIALDNQYFDDIPEFQYMNLSVDPCEDFYEYTCGNFKNVYPLHDSEMTIDHFTLLEQQLTKLASLILSEPDLDDDPQAIKKSKSAYKACMDLNYLNLMRNPEAKIAKDENGFPLVQDKSLQKATKYSLLDVGDAISKYGIPMLFNIQAVGDMINSSSNVIYISPLDSTSLTPTQIRSNHESSYEQLIEEAFLTLKKEEGQQSKKSGEVLKPFDIFLRKMVLKIRTAVQSCLTDKEVYDNLAVMVDFTRKTFTGGVVDNTTIIPIKTDNPYTATLKQLNDWTKQQFRESLRLDWVVFLQHVFSNSGIEITEETRILSYEGLEQLLYGILNLVGLNEEHVVKSYVMMRIFTHLAPDGDKKSRQYIEEYFNSTKVTILPRWQYCTRKLIDSVGTAGISFAVVYEYQLRHFNVNQYKQVFQLIQDLQESFKEMLENTSWMDETTKKIAVQKLDNMIMILGHPDLSYDKEKLDEFYENLRTCKWDNYGNSIRIKAFKNAYQISQVAKRERPFWEKSPFEVNAYYNRPNNKMIFPMAMLHPIFFGNNNSILDYGRIGSIIGHEMSHGFDSEGMKYNADGIREPWWSTETKNAFLNRTNCFIDEYNHFYEPEIQQYVNGTTTLNENIADNGGIREAYAAMKKMIKRENIVNGTKDYTPEQLFFIGFGTVWCNNPSKTYLEKKHTDVHCRSKFRVNGVVSNMEEFSTAFNCPLGSNMNPVNKCKLW